MQIIVHLTSWVCVPAFYTGRHGLLKCPLLCLPVFIKAQIAAFICCQGYTWRLMPQSLLLGDLPLLALALCRSVVNHVSIGHMTAHA